MPFKSKAQARYLFALKPAIAKEFAEKTISMKTLPENVKDEKKKKPMMPKMA
jgi:hypothetical protein